MSNYINYYRSKMRFFSELDETVNTMRGSGKELSIAELELKYGLKYGYGRGSILKRLRIHEELGVIDITDNKIVFPKLD